MWNTIALAPQEHTPALTLGASQLTPVGALARNRLVNLLQIHCAFMICSQLDACKTATFYLHYFQYFSLKVLPEEGMLGPVVHEKVVQKVAPTPIKGWPFWGRGSETAHLTTFLLRKSRVAPFEAGFQKPDFLCTFCSKNITSTWRTFTKLYSPVDMGKALLHVERHPSRTSGTYPALTLGASQLTLVGALTGKLLGQSSSNSLCHRDL